MFFVLINQYSTGLFVSYSIKNPIAQNNISKTFYLCFAIVFFDAIELCKFFNIPVLFDFCILITIVYMFITGFVNHYCYNFLLRKS